MHPASTLVATALLVLLVGCGRADPAPQIDREDLVGVASAHLQCPREHLRRTDGEEQQHVARFEGCGKYGSYRWSRGEVPFTGAKGWSPDAVQPAIDPTDASR